METNLNPAQSLCSLPDFANLNVGHFSGFDLEQHHVASGLSWRPPRRHVMCIIVRGRLCRVQTDGENERIVEEFSAA